jgi:ribosomal protein S18 acetylase RimI-like enzyme
LAELDDRETVRRLLFDYLFEFDGRTDPYPYFDAYWEEPDRLPFVLEVHGELAGLCLVRVLGEGWSIAEFYVAPEYRRSGIGRSAVEELAARARGDGAAHLEAKVHPDNLRALPFWLAAGFVVTEEAEAVVTRRSLSRPTAAPSRR